MVDAALNVAAEQVIEYSAYGALLQRDGNRGPTAAPQNLYRAAGPDEFGRTTAGSPSRSPPTSSGWRCATRSADPAWATDAELADRRRPPGSATMLIDEHLAAWCADAQRRRDRRTACGRQACRWPR